jgi:hypothetical protein
MTIDVSISPAVFWWRPACWLRVSGPDALTFLQGQFTNDLRSLERAPAVYGLWLTVKGKVLADSFVARDGGDGFWVGSYFCPAAAVRERLESHIIADDVVVSDETAEWEAVSAFGRSVETLRQDPPEAGVVFPGRRARQTHLEWVFPAARAAEARIRFSDTAVVDEATIAHWRISAGIPAVPTDIGAADLPNEGALEAEALSYTKGCYLGQEVMARLKSMGQVRRRLLRVGGSGDVVPSLPAPVFAGGRQVGELRSAVRENERGWIGLAMISLLHVDATTALSFSPDGAAALHLIVKP